MVRATKNNDLTYKINTRGPDFQQLGMLPMMSETHSGEDVAAYATGKNSDAVRGVMEQNRLYDVMYDVLIREQLLIFVAPSEMVGPFTTIWSTVCCRTPRPRHLFKDGRADVFFGLREILELRHEELEKKY